MESAFKKSLPGEQMVLKMKESKSIKLLLNEVSFSYFICNSASVIADVSLKLILTRVSVSFVRFRSSLSSFALTRMPWVVNRTGPAATCKKTV